MPVAQAADGTITTVAGTVPGFAGDGGPAIAAQLDGSQGVAIAADGSTLIADTRNNVVRRVAPNGIITTIAGGNGRGFFGDGGPARDAELDTPTDVAVLADGSVLVSDTGNDRVRADRAERHHHHGGRQHARALRRRRRRGRRPPEPPRGLTAMPDGGFLIADSGNNRIRAVSATGSISTVAGTVPGFAGDGGPASAARLNAPSKVTLTGDGGYLIADIGNGQVRRVAPNGVISTVTGGLAGPGQDTIPLTNGGVLVADGGGDQIRRVSPLGFVYTVVGGRRGLGGDGGPESAALLDTPTSLAPQAGGGILVADSGNSRVRRLTDIGQLPPPRALQTIGVAPVAGSVSVAPRGAAAAIPLREADLAPNVSRVNATAGTIQLAVRPLDAPDDAVAQVSGGSFTMVQPVADTAVADLRLNAPLACPTLAHSGATATARPAGRHDATARRRSRPRGACGSRCAAPTRPPAATRPPWPTARSGP